MPKRSTSNHLSPMQDRFCREYIVDLQPTKAAIRAGYSAKTADVKASQLLSKQYIADRISELSQKIDKATQIDATFLRLHLAEMLTADIQDIMTELGTFKPLSEWPKIWRQMISAADIKDLFEYNDQTKEKIGELVKVKFIDRLRAIELLGKHIDVSAFAENLRISRAEDPLDQLSATETYLKEHGIDPAKLISH